MTEPITGLGILAKAAAGPAGALAKRGLRAATARLKTARSASKKARAEGIDIRALALYRWLDRADSRSALGDADEASTQSAIRSLSALLPAADGEKREAKAERLLYLILHDYLSRADPSTATAIALQWQLKSTQMEGAQTRDAVAQVKSAIDTNASQSQAFSDNIATLPPWYRDEAREIRVRWPVMDAVADLLRQPAQRSIRLADWAEATPDFLRDAPAEILLWLGNISSAYGAPAAARAFYLRAVEAGATPRAYWLARAETTGSTTDPEAMIEALRQLGDSHPYPSGLVAMHSEDFATAEKLFNAWQTEGPSDTALRLNYLARLAARTDISRAISVALSGYEETKSTALGMLTAELFLTRGRHGPSALRLHDTQEALRIALLVRNSRRSWHGDSAESVVLAVTAAHLSSDPELAWRLTQPPPDGEATSLESNDPRVVQEAALTAALTRRDEQAKTLLSGIDDRFVKAHVQAVLATGPEASESWRTAFEAAETHAQRLQAASGAAELGLELPDLTELAVAHPEATAEIRLVHEAMSPGPDRLRRMQANARKSPLVATRLAATYRESGNEKLGADTLREAANHWRDPRLASMAASAYWEAGLRAEALAAANDALTMGGPTWPGAAQNYAFLVQIHSAEGRWDLAEDAARNLVSLDDQDADARWALLRCLAARGKPEGAWQILSDATVPLHPRDPQEALTWASLAISQKAYDEFVDTLLGFSRRWPDDEHLQAGLLQAIVAANFNPDTLTDAQTSELQSLFKNFTERFPDSKIFWTKELGAPEDPFAPFSDDLRRQYESLHDIHELVQQGEAPLGMLASASGSSYAEIAVRRSAGAILSALPATQQAEYGDIRIAKGTRVALDITAAHTLALLDPTTVELLFGTFPGTLTTDEAFRDSLRARDALAVKSTMTAVWNPATQKAEIEFTSSEIAERIARTSERMRELLEGIPRVAWPEIKNFEELHEYQIEWLSALDMAKELGHAFWCDDRVLRQEARRLGVPTFGTPALIAHSQQEREMDSMLAGASLANLVHNYHVDIPFERETWRLAGALDGWQPRGAAHSITRAACWSDPGAVAGFAVEAMQHVASDLPAVKGWAEAAAAGLVAITDVPEDATSNLQIFLTRVMGQSWFTPQHLPILLEGVRQRMGRMPLIEDPVEKVFRDFHSELVKALGHQLASARLFSLLALAEVSDKAMAARIILLQRD